uniref:Protein GVQW3-like n=1 Tax=Geotrypetes seraphini TaxID=260995 RepID=A0A6P8S0L2_GEOSA|nr:protein GVQW3-like [Geotrypetes seraphini]XP_033811350.1 protein GVQW3-like [Geotrypetes seraphini]
MANEEDVSVRVRQRCVIEFCVKLGKSGNETLEMLRQAYGGESISRAAVFRWWKHFKEGNTRVTDEARSGRPSTVVTDVNIAKATEMLKNDRRLTLRELSASLGISFERVQHIVTEELKMRRVCARWVPRNLTEEQMQRHIEVCKNNVTQSKKRELQS